MLKKLLSCLLVLALLCGCATKTSKSFQTDVKEESSVAEEEEETITRAEELGVTAYRQDDPQWGNDVMKPSNDTMRQSGCLVAAIASAVTMNGHTMTPGDMNALFVKKGVYDTSGNTLWQQLRKIKHYNVIVYDTTARKTLDQCLKKKRYPIICTHSLKSGNPHYVLVVNKDGKDYDVMDPKFDDLTRLSDYDYDIKLIRCVYYK
ncbi:MAG: hypothetical protein J6P61_09305 [Erysipelotrichaceae bacterium]|nr:hypothetical protein [Erysipelotrichaceae bacterium]